MKVVISLEAKADLAAISDFIARDNPTRAESFVDELLDCCTDLDDLHSTFPVIPRYEKRQIRRRLHRRYLIIYRVFEGTVEVIHIVHGARDYEALLFDEFGLE